MSLLADLKAACGTAHELGRRQLPGPKQACQSGAAPNLVRCAQHLQQFRARTWGTVVPAGIAGSDEDMDDVLAIIAGVSKCCAQFK